MYDVDMPFRDKLQVRWMYVCHHRPSTLLLSRIYSWTLGSKSGHLSIAVSTFVPADSEVIVVCVGGMWLSNVLCRLSVKLTVLVYIRKIVETELRVVCVYCF